MRHPSRFVFALHLFGASAAGCDQRADPAHAVALAAATRAEAAGPLAGFVPYVSKVGRYTIMVPRTPEITSDPMIVDGKAYRNEWLHAAASPKGAYMLQWNEAPPHALLPNFVTEYSKTTMNHLQATDVAIELVEIGGIPTAVTKGTQPQNGAVFMRVFVVDGSMYRLMTAGVPEQSALAYFASFERR